MLRLWDFPCGKGENGVLIKECFIFATKNGKFRISTKLAKIKQRKFVPIEELYEIFRNDEPFVYFNGGTVEIEVPKTEYKHFIINFFTPEGEYRRGDLIANFCLSSHTPGLFDRLDIAKHFEFSKKVPAQSEINKLKLSFLGYLKTEEEADKQAEEQAIQNEDAQREAEIQNNWREKMRLARENEALKERLEIEKKAEEEKNRLFTERLEAQKKAMEEEARLTREILEMREKAERQDLDATARTVESIRDLFGKK